MLRTEVGKRVLKPSSTVSSTGSGGVSNASALKERVRTWTGVPKSGHNYETLQLVVQAHARENPAAQSKATEGSKRDEPGSLRDLKRTMLTVPTSDDEAAGRKVYNYVNWLLSTLKLGLRKYTAQAGEALPEPHPCYANLFQDGPASTE